MVNMSFASFEEKVTLYFQALSKLSLYGEDREESTFLRIIFTGAHKTCPGLFQVIKQHDGYLYRLLDEGDHYCREEGFVVEEKLMSLLPMTEGGSKVELFWGPFQLL